MTRSTWVPLRSFKLESIQDFDFKLRTLASDERRCKVDHIWFCLWLMLDYLIFLLVKLTNQNFKQPSMCLRQCKIAGLLFCFHFLSFELSGLQFDAKLRLKYFSLYRIASSSVQKVAVLTTPAKNRRKMSIYSSVIDLDFQIKKFISLVCKLVWNWPSKLNKHSIIFCEK